MTKISVLKLLLEEQQHNFSRRNSLAHIARIQRLRITFPLSIASLKSGWINSVAIQLTIYKIFAIERVETRKFNAVLFQKQNLITNSGLFLNERILQFLLF